MTDIEFRQPIKSNGKFHHWGYIGGEFRGPLPPNQGGDSEQYASCKDKNGAKVFEGDIVKFWDKARVVKFGNYSAGGMDYYAQDAYGFYSDDPEIEGNTHTLCGLEIVIGNIHENPELLKG